MGQQIHGRDRRREAFIGEEDVSERQGVRDGEEGSECP